MHKIIVDRLYMYVHVCCCAQLLGESTQPGDLTPQLDEVHRLAVVPPLPVHPHLCAARYAALRRRVSTRALY